MPFFTSGTLITTLQGEKPVESLRPGDRIVTRENGLQTLRTIFRRDYDYAELAAAPQLWPLQVMAGSLGPSQPEKDLLVGSNLRLLVDAESAVESPEGPDALCSAKLLEDGHNVRKCAVLSVSYVHLGFDRHEIVLANGIWAESFCATDQSLGPLGTDQRRDLAEVMGSSAPNASMPAKAVGA
ncbi:MAG: Hint domain-containing protein [Paracoccaceae bacterium]